MSEWKPIETAPKNGRRIILFRDGYAEDMAICYYAKPWEEWVTVAGSTSFFGATNWMELPEPPK